MKVSSRSIAEYTGTRHGDVLAKIEKILLRLNDQEFRILNFRSSYYFDAQNQERKEIVMTQSGRDLILSKYNFVTPNKTNCHAVRDEFIFGENIVKKLFKGYRVISQFSILKYKIDWYIPELKIAIEFDEPQHFKNGKLKKKCVERQREIETVLNCKFLRYKQ